MEDRKYPLKVYFYEPDDEIKNGDPKLDLYRYMLWSYRVKATMPRMKLLKFFLEEADKSRGYSAEESAERSGLSLTSAYRAIKVLIDLGLVHQEQKAEKNETAKYRLVSRRRQGEMKKMKEAKDTE